MESSSTGQVQLLRMSQCSNETAEGREIKYLDAVSSRQLPTTMSTVMHLPTVRLSTDPALSMPKSPMQFSSITCFSRCVPQRKTVFCQKWSSSSRRSITLGTRLLRLAPSQPWATGAPSSAASPASDEGAHPDSKVWYFAIANAQSLMLEGAALETVLLDGIQRAERSGRDRDVWLIMEPAFLSEDPELESLNSRLTKPTAAILSSNADWMLTYVKEKLPQAVIGKFLAPSASVGNPLKSNLEAGGDLVGGGGIWH